MKISAYKDHPWYRPDADDYRAYVDGELIPLAYQASEEDGEVLAYQEHPNHPGWPSDDDVTLVLRGAVEIRRANG